MRKGARIAEKIVAAMRPEFVVDGRALTVTASVGVALYAGVDHITADALIKKADEALYAAKSGGRNTFRVA